MTKVKKVYNEDSFLNDVHGRMGLKVMDGL